MTSLLANPCRVLANPCRDRKRKTYDTIFRNSIEIVAIEIEIEKPHQLRNLKERQQYVDWAHIDADVLEYILKMLPLADILRCRGVCTWWRSVTKIYLSISINSLPKPYPPLIVWEKDYYEPWCFFDVLRTDGGRNLYVPNTKSQELLGQMGHCVGSSSNGGYLLFFDRVTEDEDNETLYLFHPMLFSGSALHLPLISNPYGTIDIEKAVLWGDPISDGGYYGLVVLHPCYGPPLFAKCGATQFTPLECRDKDSFLDIICVKNRLYGLIDNWNFNVWDCTTCIGSSHVPKLVLEVEPQISKPFPPSTRDLHHLVESEEEILLVVVDRPARRHLDRHGGTLAAYNKVFPICEVYKMHFNNKIWERIYSLGDRVLFVTKFQSFSVSSQEFPQYQRNSIYFWHKLGIRGEEPCLGIFNMEDGSLKIIDAKSGKLCKEVTAAAKIAFISDELCIGCSICVVKKCPFEAIQIINLPKDSEKDTTHRDGPNSFKLHRLVAETQQGSAEKIEAYARNSEYALDGLLRPNDVEGPDEEIPEFKDSHMHPQFVSDLAP